MVREVLTISCGQAGIQLNVLADGKTFVGHEMMVDIDVFFEETNGCLFVSVDLEANLIDDIKNGAFANLFQGEFLLSVKEYGGNNFDWLVAFRMHIVVNCTSLELEIICMIY